MIDLGFRYLALRANGPSSPPSSVIAYLNAEGPMQAVMWNALEKAWKFDPDAATAFLFDENLVEQRERIDRVLAEQVARDDLHVPLPTEEELRRICAAGLGAWMEEEDLSAEFEDDDEDFAEGVWQPEDDEPPRSAS